MKQDEALKKMKQNSAKQLAEAINETRLALRTAQFEVKLGKEKNVRKVRTLRRKLAQSWTVLREKQDETA